MSELDKYKLPRRAEFRGAFTDRKYKCIVIGFIPICNSAKAIIEYENGQLDYIDIKELTML